jgi:hypothetical protein
MELVLKELDAQKTRRDGLKDKSAPSPEFREGRDLPPISSLFENEIWFPIKGHLSARLDSESSSTRDHRMHHQHSRHSSDRKNREVCKALLLAMPPFPQLQEAAQKHSHMWETFVKFHFPASDAQLTLPQFVQRVAQHQDAVGIAKALQLVASVMDFESRERLLLLVDRLIIWDNVYMETLGGLDCALWQGTLFADIGQARRSW